MHDDLAWPVQGHYRCRRCNRVYEVPWEDSATDRPAVRVVAKLEPVKPISLVA
jgi:hypothetical protein